MKVINGIEVIATQEEINKAIEYLGEEFTKEELEAKFEEIRNQITIALKIAEAKQYLVLTDYKMTVDYFATLALADSSDLTFKRAEAREFIRANI